MKSTIVMPFTKETKNTYRFDVPDEEQDTAIITAVYVKKRAFKERPKSVKIVVETD